MTNQNLYSKLTHANKQLKRAKVLRMRTAVKTADFQPRKYLYLAKTKELSFIFVNVLC